MPARLPTWMPWMLLVLLLGGCSTWNLPSITQRATLPHQPGKFVWHDLLTPDAEQVKPFYARLFGWQFEHNGRYHTILSGDRPIGGIVQVEPETDHKVVARWIPSLSVADVDEAAASIERQGGVVLEGPLDLGPRGYGALVRDVGGAQVLLMRGRDGDPVDREADLNDWLWDELWSDDPARSLANYQAIAPYAVHAVNDNYSVLVAQDRWRAGIRHVFSDDLEQRWVPVVRVADPAATADQARAAGGRVIVESDGSGALPHAALIADPAGALFIVQQWDDTPVDTGVDEAQEGR